MQAPLPSSYPTQSHNQTVQAQDTRTVSGWVKDFLNLKRELKETVKTNEAQGVTTSVNVLDLQTRMPLYQHNSSQVHFAASVNKAPIAWLVLQDLRANKYKLTDTITWQPSDIRGGYGTFDQPGAPTTATVQEVLYDMLNKSGNTAVRALVNYKLGGAQTVNDRLSVYPQIPNTRLQPLDGNRFYVGNSTSKESLWVMEKLLAGNDTYQQFIKNTLATNIFDFFGVRTELGDTDYIVLANKVGILDDVEGNNRHDVGIIYNTKTHRSYGFSFMTTTPFENTTGTEKAQASLASMGRSALDYAGDKQQVQQLKPFNAQQPKPEGKVLY